MYDPVSSKVNFSEMEEAVLAYWRENCVFKASLDATEDCPEFVFYDGPPFATGLPHYGHLLAGTIKDIVPRYMTMRGHYVDRRFGWDCHGLPVEYEVEQDMGVSGKTQIEEVGVKVFNEKCRSIVLRYTSEWRKTVTRMGRWVDFDNDYKTMNATYMESIWWVFKSLWEKNLIYQGNKILPYCPRCCTPLSNFETNQGYVNVTDPAITVRFKVEGEENAFILAWTTTPWTLPSNMALAVGSDMVYVRVEEEKDGASYYLAKDRLAAYYKDDKGYKHITELKGSNLVGLKYEPLFPYFADRKADGAFRVISADFVSTEDGTGVVHIAPGFGEEDQRVGLKEGIPAVCPVDAECRFVDAVSDYKGRKVKDTDTDIIHRLKQEGKLVHRSTVVHSYPHCWRCDEPLIYRGISTWFVKVEQIKDRLIEANRKVHWVPEHLKDGRFGKWLEGARDWAISRNRYWGTPLPVWMSEDREEVVCVGSIEELEKLSGCKVQDLHKHVVDEIEIHSRMGKGMLKRIPEVLDCWFESGSMPYAQAHYPFENKEHFEKHFPADFIAEGLDQTRGWFYTLMVLSVALFDKPAFKNVIVNGLVLAEDGKKMSKRLKNYPDPACIIGTYGADALRLYMIYSPVVKAEDLRFSEEGVKHILRHILIPLWNSYSFFVTYANIDGWTGSGDHKIEDRSDNVLDRWIQSSLESLTENVVAAMDVYDLQRAVRPFIRFIEDLTNWYIRRSRRRFWKSQDDEDKAMAYETLNYVLVQLSKIAAPFIPFMSESIYRNLRTNDMPESVHLCKFPVADGTKRDQILENQMEVIMTVVKLGRQLRAEHNLKVRQPLAAMHVVSRDRAVLDGIKAFSDIITDELNVKKLAFGTHETDLVTLKAKPDFQQIGPRFGKQAKNIAGAITAMSNDALIKLGDEGKVNLNINGRESVELAITDVILERIPREGLVVASEGAVVVALETELSDDLKKEGVAREIVNKIQNERKNAGMEVAQRLRRKYHSDEYVRAAEEQYRDYIDSETLCEESECVLSMPSDLSEWNDLDINGHAYYLQIIPQ